MSKGFIFDQYRCVNCKACSAACILENQWTIRARSVYTFNRQASPLLPVAHLSLACNHCEIPVCLEGCPASAIYRETITGAVIINEDKCIGCKYCQWNCPYDAPRYDTEKNVVGKCNLCFSGLTEGRLPACATSCPTGALGYGELPYSERANSFPWFPDKDLKPAIMFVSDQSINPLRIIPDNIFKPEYVNPFEKERTLTDEWSLVGFSFLSTISVSIVISSIFKAVYPDTILSLSLIIIAGLISLFHLGKPARAWRAVTSFRSSPLSKEIVIFIIYAAFIFMTVLLKLPVFLVASSISGVILLIVIDTVYYFSDRRKNAVFHSGQTFLSTLLIISFLAGLVLPFIFIAIIRLFLSVYKLSGSKNIGLNFVIRFLRMAILLITGASLVSHISIADPFITVLFLTGELIDRVLFYKDFEPLNINTLISNQLNAAIDEKKRS